MATATASKTKAAAPEAPVLPTTFAEINNRKVRERIVAYRDIVQRHAEGKPVTVEDMEQAGELLELLGLPQYAFERDVLALQRAKAIRDKMAAAIDGQPAAKQRAADLVTEVEATRKKLEMLREEHRRAIAASTKGSTYENSLRQFGVDHPHLLADLDFAVRLRIEELDRRKQVIGGAA